MASSKQIDLKKIENFVRSKCYTEYVSKGKGKIANFKKSLKNFKVGIILHTKGKEGWYLEMKKTFNTTIP